MIMYSESFLLFRKSIESTLWDRLPVDLQIRVLLWLPPLDLRRLSFTCKYFHLFLSDPSFAIHYDLQRLTDRTFLATSIQREQDMGNTVLSSVIWQQGRDVLFQWQSQLFDHLQLHRYGWWLSCHGDGFVCFAGPQYKYLVFNPLFSHEWKILTRPAPFCTQGDEVYTYTAVAFDRKNGVCKLIIWCIVSEDYVDNGVMTFVYNFKEGTWKTITTSINGSDDYSLVGQGAQLVNERFLCWLSTDIISYVDTVLVFDVEEELWKEPIAVGNDYFICIAQHEKQLCVLSQTYEEQKMKVGVCKFDMERKVWGLVEFIAPPIMGGRDYHMRGGRGFFWVEKWGGNIEGWLCDISRHCWQYLGNFGLLENALCFEASLFRLGVMESRRGRCQRSGEKLTR